MSDRELDHFQLANRAVSNMQRQEGNGPQTDLQIALAEVLFAVVVEVAKLRHVLDALNVREAKKQSQQNSVNRQFLRLKRTNK
jgi:hypothetical protein